MQQIEALKLQMSAKAVRSSPKKKPVKQIPVVKAKAIVSITPSKPSKSFSISYKNASTKKVSMLPGHLKISQSKITMNAQDLKPALKKSASKFGSSQKSRQINTVSSQYSRVSDGQILSPPKTYTEVRPSSAMNKRTA